MLRGYAHYYARNEQLNFSIPYEFMGVSAHYEPDYLVHLADDSTLILEIKGMETEQDRAKHQAAQRWVTAVNNWGKLGKWKFRVNKDPQLLSNELREM